MKRGGAGPPLQVSTGSKVSSIQRAIPVTRASACGCPSTWTPMGSPRTAVSGAVRVGLASGVPVLTTPTTWFSDLGDVTVQTDDLAAGIARLLDDQDLRDELTAAARQHCHDNSWARTAERHRDLYASVRGRA